MTNPNSASAPLSASPGASSQEGPTAAGLALGLMVLPAALLLTHLALFGATGVVWLLIPIGVGLGAAYAIMNLDDLIKRSPLELLRVASKSPVFVGGALLVVAVPEVLALAAAVPDRRRHQEAVGHLMTPGDCSVVSMDKALFSSATEADAYEKRVHECARNDAAAAEVSPPASTGTVSTGFTGGHGPGR